jgi:hypothetical protein
MERYAINAQNDTGSANFGIVFADITIKNANSLG